jgi:hypothetical protein
MQSKKHKNSPTEKRYKCHCSCHDEGHVYEHPSHTCSCGKPIPTKVECKPEPEACQPGVVQVPQDEPVPHPPISDELPGSETRPPVGSAGEIPWFRGEINRTRFKGPRFGPRKDEFLPFLLLRSVSGDRGGRPIGGVFWESPDIYIASDQEADTAPLFPPTTAGIAQASRPNTLYAHVWNLGKAPAYRVRVEFYWFNPSLGFSPANAHLIGTATVDLANRFTLYDEWTEVHKAGNSYLTRGCHAIVRCSTTWTPTFENNGHECLVVRATEPILDPAPRNVFSPVGDRHTGQRNIAVVQAASPVSIDLALNLGYTQQAGEAVLEVEQISPDAMEWLQLYTGSRTPEFSPFTGEVAAGFLPPSPVGVRLAKISTIPFEHRKDLLRPVERFFRGCDPLEVSFHASIRDLEANQAQVLRIRQKVSGELIGGYTVVLLKSG